MEQERRNKQIPKNIYDWIGNNLGPLQIQSALLLSYMYHGQNPLSIQPQLLYVHLFIKLSLHTDAFYQIQLLINYRKITSQDKFIFKQIIPYNCFEISIINFTCSSSQIISAGIDLSTIFENIVGSAVFFAPLAFSTSSDSRDLLVLKF